MVGEPERRGGRDYYQVKWDSGAWARIPAAYLKGATPGQDLRSLIRGLAPGGREEFLRNYTFRKLTSPVDDTIYSLRASRTELVPYQLKPLVRFLDSIHRRYLIADEVGLGKTIEAGLILSELRARQTLGGVLILCPNPLRDQWRRELFDRFDEDFQIMTKRASWAHLLESSDQDMDGIRLIVGYSTIQARGLLELAQQGVPSFDLVIVDEADYARNTRTILHRQIAEIADAANQVLLLTATPIQTKIEDLLSLLRILDEPTFRNKSLFTDRLRVNSFLVAAERRLRLADATDAQIKEAAAEAVKVLSRITDFDQMRFAIGADNDLADVRSRLGELVLVPDFKHLAGVAGDLRELNLLTPYVTRTRKSEVEQHALRRVRGLAVSFHDAERAFYGAVLGWIRDRIAARHGEANVAFHSTEIERRLASCVQGFAKEIRSGGRAFDRQGLLGDPPRELVHLAEQLGTTDAKFEKLKHLIDELLRERPDRKLIVFAHFRLTLQYLERRLTKAGIGVEVIHGGIKMAPGDPERDDRGNAVKRFLDDSGPPVLLSSSVGGEGLNLQRASVVINYDLPWNPAKVEQRIGRVDRFGQREPYVQVANLVIDGTVEELIYGRLYERLDIFKTALGDFAAVLGPIVQSLSEEYLAQELTEEEREGLLRKAEWRIENAKSHLDEILEHEHEFVAYDEDFTDHIKGLDERGQTVRPDELARVCERVIERRYRDSWLRPVTLAGGVDVLELKLDFHLRDRVKRLLNDPRRSHRVIRSFLTAFPEGRPGLVTFDGEIAEAHSELVLLTSRHPFLRALMEDSASTEGFYPFSHLSLPKGVGAISESGLLCLFDAQLRFGAIQRRYLLPVYMTKEAFPYPRDDSARMVRTLLDNGQAGVADRLPPASDLERLLDLSAAAADSALSEIAEQLVHREEARARPRINEVSQRYARRMERAEERLAAAEGQEEDQKRLANLRDYPRRLDREREQLLRPLLEVPDHEQSLKEVGAVWVEVA